MQAIFKPPRAMRGGIQICFPQVLILSVTWNIYFSGPSLLQTINLLHTPEVWKLRITGATWLCEE